ncbi:carboxylate--amine ligase [Luteipulveratus sp. YIM 133132]|uniref:carboxylate--amine ligase n=1 Tax=Luteipulveratus flavus TaxID=3031728 RepID=UPI0023AF5613|nr:carboxylate--amine ligase [Luteipulveratus sp. YIM 133132]MDE9367110.1 carboxylate--amine ligase [Luteipulveratus sp. YIM 133132]
MTRVPDTQRFVPVLLGADASTYSLARSFHEEYDVVSVAVSRLGAGPVANSRIIETSQVSDLDDADALVAHLLELGERFGETPLILLSSTDFLVRRIVELRHKLEPRFTIPYPDLALIERMTDKAQFSELCGELAIPHPQTVVYEVARHPQLRDDAELLAGLKFPIIAKTGNSALYHQYDFPGKQKVHTAASREELMDLMQRVHDSGYPGTFILQDMIPGLDEGMRILTCYSDKSGAVRFASYGHVLMEEHLPATLGVPAAIVTGENHEVVQEAKRLLEHVGWRGYANFDLKYDPRDGRTKFFELNPRLGRSNFYVTASGHNPVRYYVEEYVEGSDLSDEPALLESSKEELYTSLPVPLLLRYLPNDLRRKVIGMAARGRVTNPMMYVRDPNPRRWAYVLAYGVNQVRKYARVYPPPKRDRDGQAA